jgi:hypothetical protein
MQTKNCPTTGGFSYTSKATAHKETLAAWYFLRLSPPLQWRRWARGLRGVALLSLSQDMHSSRREPALIRWSLMATGQYAIRHIFLPGEKLTEDVRPEWGVGFGPGRPDLLPQGEEERLTASAGIAWHRGGEDARALFERADAALLRAKRQGRGKIARAT